MPQENLNHLAEQNPSYERLNIVKNPDLGRYWYRIFYYDVQVDLLIELRTRINRCFTT